jgi:hypothetical protein
MYPSREWRCISWLLLVRCMERDDLASEEGTIRGYFEQNVFIGAINNQDEADTRSKSSSRPFMTFE